MKIKALTVAQIDTLAQRLSDTPIEPATSAKKAGDTFARLLAARIRDERAALAFTSILTADSFEQAEARLTLVLDYGNADPVVEPIPVADDEPKAATAPVIGKRQAILDQAQNGALPPAPEGRGQRVADQRGQDCRQGNRAVEMCHEGKGSNQNGQEAPSVPTRVRHLTV